MSSIQANYQNYQSDVALYTRSHRSGKKYRYQPAISRRGEPSETSVTPQVQRLTQLLLIRHGETDWNLQDLYLGQTDIPLNGTGKKQAKNLTTYLRSTHPDISAIYSSDLARARASAQYAARAFNTSVHETSALREINWGVVEGLDVPETDAAYQQRLEALKKQYPNRTERWAHEPLFPQGETYNDLLGRVKAELQRIATAHPGEKVAVFAHGRILRTLVSESTDHADVYPKLPNCAVVQFRFAPENTHCPFTCLSINQPA